MTDVLQPCQLYQDATEVGSKMLCRMPAVRLPDYLREQLNVTEYGTINYTRGPGVIVYFSADGRTRVDIYIGLKLDGDKRYENISSVDPTIKFQFTPNPVVLCTYDDIAFDSHKDQVIVLKVN